MRRLQGQVLYDDAFVVLEEDALELAGDPYLDSTAGTTLLVNDWRYRYVKRALDVICASLMLIGFLVPGLVIAAIIRLSSPYPVFYREERIGRDGKAFQIWKFRSMRPHRATLANPGTHPETTVLQWRMQKRKDDPRITPVGRFLRRWSLDELPQIFNVLRGEMSLIGPRPVVKAETYLYKGLLPYYLSAKPGLSGLWQVSGRSNLDYDERAELDASYVQTWSLALDINILLRTLPAVLSRVGAR